MRFFRMRWVSDMEKNNIINCSTFDIKNTVVAQNKIILVANVIFPRVYLISPTKQTFKFIVEKFRRFGEIHETVAERFWCVCLLGRAIAGLS
jgi:hypothetical protein